MLDNYTNEWNYRIIQEMFNEICEKKARYHMYTT